MDIIAEVVSDDAELRKSLRETVTRHGIIASSFDETAESVYENYYDYNEPVSKIAQHRILALDRGEKEGFKISIAIPEGMGTLLLIDKYVKNDSNCGRLVKLACEDSFKRLIYPSIEREIRSELTENAAEQAIKVCFQIFANF